MDITADGAMEFFTSRRKVTTKWSMRGKRLHFVVPVCELLSGRLTSRRRAIHLSITPAAAAV
jgi:hypothetical protein